VPLRFRAKIQALLRGFDLSRFRLCAAVGTGSKRDGTGIRRTDASRAVARHVVAGAWLNAPWEGRVTISPTMAGTMAMVRGQKSGYLGLRERKRSRRTRAHGVSRWSLVNAGLRWSRSASPIQASKAYF